MPVTAVTGATASLSTGRIQLFKICVGNFYGVGDSLDVLLENSAILDNEAHDEDSHGLGLYNHVNLTTSNSVVNDHSLDGIHISLVTEWTDENSLVRQR